VLRKLTKLCLIATGAIAAWPVASTPALRAHTPAAHAHDFERQVPALSRVGPLARPGKAPTPGSGPVTFRSAVVQAPHRFDAVGVAGAIKPVEFRARKTGGGWSGWIATEDGNPVFTGGTDELQMRSRGWRPRGRLHYVSVPSTRAPPALKRAEKTGEPTVITRRQWGATDPVGGCLPRTAPVMGKVKAAVIHHTVTSNDYKEADGPAIVLAICRFHRNGNGWNDIGYNALVDRYGNIYVGRAGGLKNAVVGAHAQGFNAQTTGVASIGTYTDALMRGVTLDAIARLLAWKLPLSGLDATGRSNVVSAGGDLTQYPAGTELSIRHIVGHLRLDATACPGAGAKSQLQKIRALTQALIDGTGTGSGHHGRRHPHRNGRHGNRHHGRSGGVGPG
jgi:hypothetical protein